MTTTMITPRRGRIKPIRDLGEFVTVGGVPVLKLNNGDANEVMTMALLIEKAIDAYDAYCDTNESHRSSPKTDLERLQNRIRLLHANIKHHLGKNPNHLIFVASQLQPLGHDFPLNSPDQSMELEIDTGEEIAYVAVNSTADHFENTTLTEMYYIMTSAQRKNSAILLQELRAKKSLRYFNTRLKVVRQKIAFYCRIYGFAPLGLYRTESFIMEIILECLRTKSFIDLIKEARRSSISPPPHRERRI